jgi:ketosteroid isomerase-like protein
MTSREAMLLKNFNDAFNRHDVQGMLALMTEDCVFENTYPAPDGTRYQGYISLKIFWDEFFASSPQARIEIEEMFASQAWGVQRWIYLWIDAQGMAGHVRGVDVFRFKDGKIAEKLSYVKG